MGLTLQFIPFGEVTNLSSEKRIQRILDSVRDNKIVLLEGRLDKKEEASLIEKTMESIDDQFKGIELSVVYPETKNDPWYGVLKRTMLTMLLGNRLGFTIVGPASIVKEIKRNPGKIELLTKESRKKRNGGK